MTATFTPQTSSCCRTQADLTLARSSSAAWTLRSHGVARVERWGRGVDLDRFDPSHRSAALRRRLAPHGELLVGYVGRLAAEKQVHLLRYAAAPERTRTVVVGTGPLADRLQQQLPHAVFVGAKAGSELSAHFASSRSRCRGLVRLGSDSVIRRK